MAMYEVQLIPPREHWDGTLRIQARTAEAALEIFNKKYSHHIDPHQVLTVDDFEELTQ